MQRENLRSPEFQFTAGIHHAQDILERVLKQATEIRKKGGDPSHQVSFGGYVAGEPVMCITTLAGMRALVERLAGDRDLYHRWKELLAQIELQMEVVKNLEKAHG